MQALRVIQDVAPDGCLHVKIPAGMGKRFEMIILPVADEETVESNNYMKLQEESGFVKRVIASPEEDVWNDL